ncbi:MAG: hypothetical protein L3J45_03885 [Flavobacteriaceae bacterium]|nr:hypothetical protein [Flavobacteriaceae bacterium]
MKKNNIYTLGALILLTLSTALISGITTLKIGTLLILGLSAVKFLLVAFNFMALKKAHIFWQIALIGFLIVFVGIVGIVI